MKDIICRWAYSQKILIWLFSERTIRTIAKIYVNYIMQLVWNLFSMNDREVAQWLTVHDIQILHKCDNY